VTEADVVVIGAGAAGLSLARHLAGTPSPGHGTGAGPGPTALSAAVVEAPPGPLRPGPRTWCFWEDGPGELDETVYASWDRLTVYQPDGTRLTAQVAPLRYKMIRSADFEAAVDRTLGAHPRITRLTGTVTGVRDGPSGADVAYTTEQGAARRLRARWVFDSRPPGRLPPARSTLLQHFRGWFVRLRDDAFDPGAAVLMDLRTPQPRQGLSFGYVLPFSAREALVEYTEFSPRVREVADYERELHRYTRQVLGLGPLEVTAAEQGVIPMTDAVFPVRAGASVFRIGGAGGATRPSTGYTFAPIQRQVRAVADALRTGRTPEPPPVHAARARAMDAVLLRALSTGRLDGAEFFGRLFRRNPAPRLLRFLDGRAGPLEELRVGLTTPVTAMLLSALEVPLLPRRTPALPHPARNAPTGAADASPA
jgi:lycopene beta-cyclase